MRARSMLVLFGGVLAGLGTMGGSPCGGNCADIAAHTEAIRVSCADLASAGATGTDAGFSIVDAGLDGAAVFLEGDARVTSSVKVDGGFTASTGDTVALPLAMCSEFCGSTITGCRMRAGNPNDVPNGIGCTCCFFVDCDYTSRPGRCVGGSTSP